MQVPQMHDYINSRHSESRIEIVVFSHDGQKSFLHQKIRDGANRDGLSILLKRRLFRQCDNR